MKRPPYQSKDGSTTITVPCGKCILCLKRRQSQWVFRLSQEARNSLSVSFVTLTYESTPYSPSGFPTLKKRDWQLFMKRLRKQLSKRHKDFGYKSPKDVPKLKYYMCGEYGTLTHRPHYHAILYNLPHMLFPNDFISQIWTHGLCTVDVGNMNTMSYCTKYVMKSTWKVNEIVDQDTGEIFADDRQREFSLMSKGLGAEFLTPQMKLYLKNRCQSFVMQNGFAVGLPRYYKDKIFTKREKEMLTEAAKEARELNFEKIFNNDYRHENEWKKDQIRRQQKTLVLERCKI